MHVTRSRQASGAYHASMAGARGHLEEEAQLQAALMVHVVLLPYMIEHVLHMHPHVSCMPTGSGRGTG